MYNQCTLSRLRLQVTKGNKQLSITVKFTATITESLITTSIAAINGALVAGSITRIISIIEPDKATFFLCKSVLNYHLRNIQAIHSLQIMRIHTHKNGSLDNPTRGELYNQLSAITSKKGGVHDLIEILTISTFFSHK